MKHTNMTIEQVEKACHENNFIILRTMDRVQAINTKVLPITKRKGLFTLNEKTQFHSFRPCTFHEYISLKEPFL